MLINILYLIIGIALTLVWIKVIKQKTPLNFQEIVKDKFWLIITGSLIVAIGYLYFYLPQVFEWLAVEFWGVPSSTITEDGKTKVLQLTDLGPLGDIYGSLNTLFTSATLAFVIYATLLQRQANNDAREAMAKQLRQARNATRKQLRQSQLSTKRQLALAQATHDAQMKESKYAIFSNMFYAALNQKHERFNMIEIRKDDKHLNIIQILLIINDELFRLITQEWKDISQLERDEVHSKYMDTMKKISMESDFDIGDNLSNLSLYLVGYGNIFELINRNNLSKEDEYFFKCIVRDSMTIGEQVAMFWLAAFNYDVRIILEKNQVISNFFDERMMPFAVKFLSKDCFFSEHIKDKWHDYE